MILGLRTVIYPVTDLNAAKAWYASVVERQPYFDEPYYVGFEVGGFELGLIPDGTPGPGGANALWGVPDIVAEVKRLTALGAGIREPVNEVGGGIKVATLIDPDGNSFGLIENPHFSVEKVR
jgi:predicted enzyme related to lactoylglutathione lyase